MTAIANVALSNTFDYWRIRTNEAIGFINNNAANNAYLTSTFTTNTSFQTTLANTNAYIATTLANTNTYIATKVNTSTFNSALANTNTYIATKVNTSTFNSALANTNAYIAGNLANTNTYIATKVNTSTFNSALANTNAYIAAAPTLASNNDFTSTNQMRLGAPVKTTTSNAYTLAVADAGFYHRLNYANTSASGNTTVGITIPNNATVSIPVGSEYLFIRTGSNSAFHFSNAAGVTVNSDRGKLRVLYQWQSAVCKKVATDEWDLLGNLST